MQMPSPIVIPESTRRTVRERPVGVRTAIAPRTTDVSRKGSCIVSPWSATESRSGMPKPSAYTNSSAATTPADREKSRAPAQ